MTGQEHPVGLTVHCAKSDLSDLSDRSDRSGILRMETEETEPPGVGAR